MKYERRKGVSRISMIQKTRLSEYSKIKVAWQKDHKTCEKCGARAEKEPHHSRGRVGALLCDTRFWKALCFDCHNWAHANIPEAREQGLICELGKWNTPER